MTQNDAADLADKFISVILENQPEILGAVALSSEESAQQAAESLARFRERLIEKLTPQAPF